MTKTKIEWATDTWNPIRAQVVEIEEDGLGSVVATGWHCEKISAGCANCYAERFNGRRLPAGGTGLRYARDQRNKAKTYLDESVLAEPLRWRKPRRVFVCSMTDLFGEWVTDEQIGRVFDVMMDAGVEWHGHEILGEPRHVFIVLTKRPDRMRRFIADFAKYNGGWPASWIWLGVSVEDQATADERIPHLIQTPAAKRFVSYEPALGPVDFTRLEDDELGAKWNALESGLDLVIFGGESGPGARPCNVEWARSAMDQCKTAGVSFFLKQLGREPRLGEMLMPNANGKYPWRDRKGGDMLEWPADLRVREVPE